MKKDSDSNQISEEIKKLVIARIEAQISPNIKLSIGEEGSFNKEEMIKHVENGDDIGEKIINVHINFIKAQASGQLGHALTSI